MARLTKAQQQLIIDAFHWTNQNKEITGDEMRQFFQNFLDSFAEGLLSTGESIEEAITTLKNKPGGSSITFSNQFTIIGDTVYLNLDYISAGEVVNLYTDILFLFEENSSMFKSYANINDEHVFVYDAYNTTGGSVPPACVGVAPYVAVLMATLTPSFAEAGQYKITMEVLATTLPTAVNGLYVVARQSAGTLDGNKLIPFTNNAAWQRIELELNVCSVPLNPLTAIEIYFTKASGANLITTEDQEFKIRNLIVEKL